MYNFLRRSGKPVIQFNGPLAGLYKRLGLIRVYQFISLPLVAMFFFIADCERRDYGTPTLLSLSCIALAVALIILFIVSELRPLKAVQAIEVIKDLIGQEDDWEDFILWFNTEKQLSTEVSRQLWLVHGAGEDPQGLLCSKVQSAMRVLTGHRTTAYASDICRNPDPVPGD